MRFSLALLVMPGLLALAASSCKDQTSETFPPAAIVPDGGGVATPDGEAPPPEGEMEILSGDPSKGFLLEGTVLGEASAFEGQVLVLPDGTIGCVDLGDACAREPAATDAARVVTKGVIAPGLIDTHNHILFDVFDGSDWTPTTAFQNHDEWPSDPRYIEVLDAKQCLEDASQGKPTWCPAKYDGPQNHLKCEMDKWGELKGLIAGTTSIVGLAGSALPCYGTLARSIDTPYNELAQDKVQVSALFPPSKTTADGVCSNFALGRTESFVIHCGEGIDARSLGEFTKLGAATTNAGCLYAPPTAITHGTAFTATEFAAMKQANMKLVWSPASNVGLYGKTTDIPAALAAGVSVAVAPDWSLGGGSQNMLDELRFAKTWSDKTWGGLLGARDIVTMATANAAGVLALQARLGTLKKGLLADIVVVRGDRSKPYDAVVAATPSDVRLTMVGGKALYGDGAARALGAFGPACEELDVCGRSKFVCVSVPGSTVTKATQTLAQIRTALETGMADVDTAKPAAMAPVSPLAPLVACRPR
jgi:cytosine/adenosine deaminase-related metal-dependent hydrolase